MNRGGTFAWAAGIAASFLSCAPVKPESAESLQPTPREAPGVEAKAESKPLIDKSRKSTPPVAAEKGEEEEVEPSRPPSPFRKVIDGRDASLFVHDAELLYVGDRVLLNLSTGETLARCDYMRGILMSGKSLYFAARLSPYSACPDEPFLLERVGAKWPVRRFIDAHDLILQRWVAGTTIAAVVPYRIGPPFGYELVKVAGGVSPPRPMRGASHPTEPERKCYSELQQPLALHAFPSGALRIVGAYLCDLPRSEDEEVSPEEEKARGRPAIESFAKGSYTSQIFRLPIDEVISSIEGDSEVLFILGKIKQGYQQDAPFELVLLSFDGKAVTRHAVDVSGVERLARGTTASETTVEGAKEGSEAKSESFGLPGDLWLSSAGAMRRASGEGEPLWFPEKCPASSPRFWRGHVWIACEDGIYTTDPEHAMVALPADVGESSCDELDPRPEYAVRGIYQKPSSAGGCSRRREFDLFEGEGKTKAPHMKRRPTDPWGGSGASELPRPKSAPSKLKLQL